MVAVPLLIASSNLPPVRSDGAPGDVTCTDCHSPSGGTATVTVTFPSGLTYSPGVTQRLRVTVSETGKVRWGFQLSARTASNLSAQAGDLNPVDTLTGVLCGNSAAKTAAGCPTNAPLEFIEQTSAGTQAGTANSAFWDIDWTPPATNVGNVQIYVAGLAANGNGSNSGDDTATANYTLTPATTSTVPALTVNPASLTFAAVVGGSAPAAQTFQAGSSGSSLTFTTSTTTASGGNWLQATPSGGSTPLDVSVSVSPTGLAAGTYTGSVSVMSTGASNSPLPVSVTFTVSPVQGAPILSATPPAISFTLPAGGAKATQTSHVSSITSGLTLSAAATTTSGGSWLSVTSRRHHALDTAGDRGPQQSLARKLQRDCLRHGLRRGQQPSAHNRVAHRDQSGADRQPGQPDLQFDWQRNGSLAEPQGGQHRIGAFVHGRRDHHYGRQLVVGGYWRDNAGEPDCLRKPVGVGQQHLHRGDHTYFGGRRE